jgi:hypothetical protein
VIFDETTVWADKQDCWVTSDLISASRLLIDGTFRVFWIYFDRNKLFSECKNAGICERFGIQPITEPSPVGIKVHHYRFAGLRSF